MQSSQANHQADNYAYEEEQERLATLKNIHRPMKLWYNKASVAPLKAKCGNFPTFWQDLEAWDHYLLVKKIYFVCLEQGVTGDEETRCVEKTLAKEEDSGKGEQVEVEDAEEEEENEEGKSKDEAGEKNKMPSMVEEEEEEEEEHTASGAIESKEDSSSTKQKRRRWAFDEEEREAFRALKKKREEEEGKDGHTAGGEHGRKKKRDRKKKRRRVSRWGPVPPLPSAMAMAGLDFTGDLALTPLPVSFKQSSEDMRREREMRSKRALSGLEAKQVLLLQHKLQALKIKLSTVASDAAARDANPNRSPSPSPVYDENGVRTNTTELRMREELLLQRSEAIEGLMKLNTHFRPPADFSRTKKVLRVYIPVDQFPHINFLGMVIGPRGTTQKALESEYRVKISLRGRGTVKPGSNYTEDADDDMHVWIQGEDQEMLERAAKHIRNLVEPGSETHEAHKSYQMQQLAVINGQNFAQDVCGLCGEKGHQSYECPYRATGGKKPSNKVAEQLRMDGAINLNIKCAICGDGSHPTRDCPFQDKESNSDDVKLNQEYMEFMSEIGVGSGGGGPGFASTQEVLPPSQYVPSPISQPGMSFSQQPPLPPSSSIPSAQQLGIPGSSTSSYMAGAPPLSTPVSRYMPSPVSYNPMQQPYAYAPSSSSMPYQYAPSPQYNTMQPPLPVGQPPLPVGQPPLPPGPPPPSSNPEAHILNQLGIPPPPPPST